MRTAFKIDADGIAWIEKDPVADKDYSEDWSGWLGTDTIATSTWSADAGITIHSPGFDDGVTTIWISGGTLGQKYRITNTVTTTGGRTDARSFYVVMKAA